MSNETKWTPGPWGVVPGIRAGFGINGLLDSNASEVVGFQDEEARYGSIHEESDATLIAAAPDLYEALNNLVVLHVREQEGISSGMPTSDEWIEAVDIAADALHKACNGSLK